MFTTYYIDEKFGKLEKFCEPIESSKNETHEEEREIISARKEFEEILKYVTGEAQELEMHEVERGLFNRLLSLGLTLLKVFIAKRGIGYVGKEIETDKGERLPYHSTKSRWYFSIFGKLKIPRAYYWHEGSTNGIYPLDSKLNLPERIYSHFLMEWAEMFGVSEAFDKVTTKFEKLLRIKLWKRPIEEISCEAGNEVQGFYQEKAAPSPETEEEILVVAVDTKGIPMIKSNKAERKVRLKKGEKRSKKKKATVSAVYTILPYKRSPEDVVSNAMDGYKAMLENRELPEKPDRPIPQNKRVRATLEEKDVAFAEIRRQVNERDPHNKKERVALVDGESALHKKIKHYLKGFVIVLDLFHLLEYLWTAAHVFYKEGTADAELWVRERLLAILRGRAGYVIGGLKQILTKRHLSKVKEETLEKVIRYFSNNKEYIRYNEYLAKGYPIGSGVVEGACRNLVKDRMELTGMRWSVVGAQAMLELRAVDINNNWEEFWDFWIKRKKAKLYGSNHFSICERTNKKAA